MGIDQRLEALTRSRVLQRGPCVRTGARTSTSRIGSFDRKLYLTFAERVNIIAASGYMTQSSLLSLAPVDVFIIAVYFVMVLGIGFYLKEDTNTARSSSSPAAK